MFVVFVLNSSRVEEQYISYNALQWDRTLHCPKSDIISEKAAITVHFEQRHTPCFLMLCSLIFKTDVHWPPQHSQMLFQYPRSWKSRERFDRVHITRAGLILLDLVGRAWYKRAYIHISCCSPSETVFSPSRLPDASPVDMSSKLHKVRQTTQWTCQRRKVEVDMIYILDSPLIESQ